MTDKERIERYREALEDIASRWEDDTPHSRQHRDDCEAVVCVAKRALLPEKRERLGEEQEKSKNASKEREAAHIRELGVCTKCIHEKTNDDTDDGKAGDQHVSSVPQERKTVSNLETYLELEKRVDELQREMDKVWCELSDEDHKFLNQRSISLSSTVELTRTAHDTQNMTKESSDETD